MNVQGLAEKGQNVSPYDLIGKSLILNPHPSYNHGCRDYAEVVFTKVINANTIKGVVIYAQNCNSCWQVGHDTDHVFATIGESQFFDLKEISNLLKTGCELQD